MKRKIKKIEYIASLVIAIIAFWYFWGGGIEKQVADDTIKEYTIAKESGNAMDAYVRAGLVAEAYLQAKDETNYKKWKKIEKQEAIRAGIPTD